MDLRIFTEPQQGASYDTLLSADDAEIARRAKVLDLSDLDHIAMLGAEVLPRV